MPVNEWDGISPLAQIKPDVKYKYIIVTVKDAVIIFELGQIIIAQINEWMHKFSLESIKIDNVELCIVTVWSVSDEGE